MRCDASGTSLDVSLDVSQDVSLGLRAPMGVLLDQNMWFMFFPPPQGLKAGAPCPKLGQVFGEAWVPEAEAAQMACPTGPPEAAPNRRAVAFSWWGGIGCWCWDLISGVPSATFGKPTKTLSCLFVGIAHQVRLFCCNFSLLCSC